MSMSVPRYVSSFLAGFVVGAGLTLIYAPMTGKKMQRRIGRLNDEVIDKVSDKVSDLKAAVVRAAS